MSSAIPYEDRAIAADEDEVISAINELNAELKKANNYENVKKAYNRLIYVIPADFDNLYSD